MYIRNARKTKSDDEVLAVWSMVSKLVLILHFHTLIEQSTRFLPHSLDHKHIHTMRIVPVYARGLCLTSMRTLTWMIGGQLEVQCLARGYVHMQTGGDGDQATDLLTGRRLPLYLLSHSHPPLSPPACPVWQIRWALSKDLQYNPPVLLFLLRSSARNIHGITKEGSLFQKMLPLKDPLLTWWIHTVKDFYFTDASTPASQHFSFTYVLLSVRVVCLLLQYM